MNEIKEIIEKFVSENFIAESCKECHEVGHSLVPDDFKGSYDKEVTKLLDQLKAFSKCKICGKFCPSDLVIGSICEHCIEKGE